MYIVVCVVKLILSTAVGLAAHVFHSKVKNYSVLSRALTNWRHLCLPQSFPSIFVIRNNRWVPLPHPSQVMWQPHSKNNGWNEKKHTPSKGQPKSILLVCDVNIICTTAAVKRETDRDRERETKRQRERQRERHRERHTQRETERQRDTQRETERDTYREHSLFHPQHLHIHHSTRYCM